MKPLLVTLTAALALLAAGVGSATAGTPCWKKVLNDWVDRNGIQGTYPTRCYQEAIRHLPPDIQIYSSAEADLRRAMLLAFHTRDGGPGGGSGFGGGASPTTDLRGLQASPGNGEEHRGALTRAINWLGPSDASSVPTPLLVLASVALLLLASAAGSFVARRINARRKPKSA